MDTSLCNLCHVDKLINSYSTLSETKQKKIERPAPPQLGSTTRTCEDNIKEGRNEVMCEHDE